MLLLMELKFRMGPPDMKVLRLAFNPRHNEACAQGWEEATDTSLLCLLKTTLSKDPKEGIRESFPDGFGDLCEPFTHHRAGGGNSLRPD